VSLGKVLITATSVSSSKAALDLLERAGCEIEVATPPAMDDEAWVIEHSKDKNALVFTMERVTESVIKAVPGLKVIARPGVGYDTVDIDACTRRGIVVTIAAGQNDQSVADFTMGLMILTARRILDAANACNEHKWQRFVGTEVWNKTLTIVGLGRIGKGVAQRARGFDMNVLAVTEPGDEEFAAQHGIRIVDLETGLREADFLSLHVPLLPSTRNMIDARAISMMKPGAILINAARGGLLDEQAVADAVASGRLGGAAVDVLEVQGANSPSPLIGVPGIIVTPHMATYAREAQGRVAASVAQSVVTALQGERPAHVVNPDVYGTGS